MKFIACRQYEHLPMVLRISYRLYLARLREESALSADTFGKRSALSSSSWAISFPQTCQLLLYNPLENLRFYNESLHAAGGRSL
ncbi:hypothetical protein [Cyclobacterium lianum]|uniref:hypothetical protein n=1 Tax=Cyclobacterium lianum TaxID=388280 RepID=UPI001160125E|nr:hypothetical protein [Cyclobacterium lianum]